MSTHHHTTRWGGGSYYQRRRWRRARQQALAVLGIGAGTMFLVAVSLVFGGVR